MPIFLLFVILFTLWVRYEAKKNSQIESDSKTTFIEMEQKANFSRKADITNLNYISIPVNELPFTEALF